MAEFLIAQLDYVYFVFGLAFFVIAGVSYIMSQEREQKLPWGWLACFGFINGTHKWLSMTSLAFSEMPQLVPIKSLILLASFVCLFEFGRVSLKRLTGWPIGPWLTVLLAGASLLCYPVDGWVAVSAASRLLLACPGSILAALSFFLLARRSPRDFRLIYRLIGLVFLVYAFSQLFSPAGRLFLFDLFSQAKFLAWFNMPVQLFRAVLGVIIFSLVWMIWAGGRGSEKQGRSYWSRFSLLGSLILILTTILVGGWFLTQSVGSLSAQSVRENILERARMIAFNLDIDQVAGIYGTPEDIDRTDYQQIKTQLARMNNVIKDIRFVYLLGLRGGSAVFLVDGEPADSPDYAPPGTIYSDAPPEVLAVFEQGLPQVTRPYRDHWGRWVTALVPLKDPGSGYVTAVLGTSMPENLWQQAITSSRQAAIGMIMVVSLIIVGVFIFLQYSFEVTNRLAASEARYRRLFEAVQDGILILDAETGQIFDVNPFLTDLLGYPQEYFMGKMLWEIGLFKDVAASKEAFLELKAKKYTRYEDLPLKTKDGRRIEVEFVSNIYEVDSHKVIQFNIRDITERKRLEAAVGQEKENLAVTLHSIGDGVIATDPLGKVTMINEVAEDLTGWPLSEAVGHGFDEVFHIVNELTRQRCPNPVEQVLKTGKTVLLGNHTLLISKSGQERPIDDSAAPIRDAQGRIIGVVLVFRDVTEKRKNELELKRSKDYAENIIKSANVMIIGLDLAGNVTVFNEAAEAVTGYSREEMLEKNWFKTVVPSDRYPEVWKEFAKMNLDERIIRAYENPILTKHGEEKIISWQNSELRQGDKLLGILSFGVDVTERRHDEMEIRRLSQAMKQSPAIIVITDTDGNIQYINPKFTEVTGYELREVIGQNPRILKSGETPAETYKTLWQTIKAGGKWRGEFHNKKKNGQLYWENASISSIKNPQGEIVNYLAVEEDITERKRLEKSKDEFVSTVSHELRTPLTIIHEGVAQVAEGLHGETNDRQKKILGFATEAINRLTRIIDNLLDISRLDSGKIEMNFAKADLVALTKDVCRSFKFLADKQGLELKEFYNPDRIELPLDHDKIIQIFNNLIGNAVKFTKKGYIEVSLVDNGDQVTCCVLDTGPGIAPENMPKLFSKFEQFGRTVGTGEKGTGLGLAIAKGIVEQHGGYIWLESTSAAGSKFIFTLPK